MCALVDAAFQRSLVIEPHHAVTVGEGLRVFIPDVVFLVVAFLLVVVGLVDDEVRVVAGFEGVEG